MTSNYSNEVTYQLSGVVLDEENDEDMTPAQVLSELTQAFVNEIAAPKLLPHKYPLVECLIDQVEHMENNIAKQRDKKQIKCTAHRMELYRISYVINSYLRVRLKKIEENLVGVLHEHENRSKQKDKDDLMDEKELAYAEDLQKARTSIFNDSFLKMIPTLIQSLPVVQPALSRSRVFIDVIKSGIEETTVVNMMDPSSDVIITLEKGSRHLIPFQSIENHLEQGNLTLL